MQVNCSYVRELNDYTCTVDSQNIPPDADLKFGRIQNIQYLSNPVFGVVGNVDNNDNVTKIVFSNCNMIKIPQGLKKSFKNLSKMELRNTTLKTLTKHDLTEYKDFKEFHSKNNKIEFLPGDLFEGFKNLETILFTENNLKFIEPTILDGLNNLKHADFGRDYNPNQNITEQLSPHLIKKVLNEMITAQPVEEWMKHPLSTGMLRHFYKTMSDQHLTNERKLQISYNNKAEECEHFKTLSDNLTLQIGNLKVEHEKEKGLYINKGLYTDINIFIQDETTKDFCIQIDNRDFQVHKFLLAARSPTLAEILKNNPEVENLNLVDISVEIFEIILKFLYTDELPGDVGMNFLQLFAAAGKLKIQELKNFAAEKIYDLIDINNMLDALKLGNKYDDNLMRQKAFSKVKEKYPKIEYKDEWINETEKIEKMINFFKEMEEKEAIFKKLME